MMIKTYAGRPMKSQNKAGPDLIRVILHEKHSNESEKSIQLVVPASEYAKNVGEVFFPETVKRADAVRQLIAQSKARR